jgi:hypothetical protein
VLRTQKEVSNKRRGGRKERSLEDKGVSGHRELRTKSVEEKSIEDKKLEVKLC